MGGRVDQVTCPAFGTRSFPRRLLCSVPRRLHIFCSGKLNILPGELICAMHVRSSTRHLLTHHPPARARTHHTPHTHYTHTTPRPNPLIPTPTPPSDWM